MAVSILETLSNTDGDDCDTQTTLQACVAKLAPRTAVPNRGEPAQPRGREWVRAAELSRSSHNSPKMRQLTQQISAMSMYSDWLIALGYRFQESMKVLVKGPLPRTSDHHRAVQECRADRDPVSARGPAVCASG